MQLVKLLFSNMKPTRPTTLLIAFLSLIFSTFLPAQSADSKRILFLGDSLTAGYGIDPQSAYPNLIAEKIKTLGLDYSVTPAGLSGETSAGGLRRISWVMQKPVAILVIALGSNDGLRGIELSDTRKNLQGIIDFARNKNPEIQIVIAGMQMPPNLGETYTNEFRGLFPRLAQANETALIPFLLEGETAPDFYLADRLHPTPKGHTIVAETVWQVLQPLLEK